MFKAKIISNLSKHPAKWVNPFITLGGLMGENLQEGVNTPHDDLNELIREGIVEKNTVHLGFDKFDRPIHGDLYRHTPGFEDLGRKLTLVK